MVGGYVVQVVPQDKFTCVELLDEENFDRCWRKVPSAANVRLGDRIWWQSRTGYLTRPDVFSAEEIGACFPIDNPQKIYENGYWNTR